MKGTLETKDNIFCFKSDEETLELYARQLNQLIISTPCEEHLTYFYEMDFSDCYSEWKRPREEDIELENDGSIQVNQFLELFHPTFNQMYSASVLKILDGKHIILSVHGCENPKDSVLCFPISSRNLFPIGFSNANQIPLNVPNEFHKQFSVSKIILKCIYILTLISFVSDPTKRPCGNSG